MRPAGAAMEAGREVELEVAAGLIFREGRLLVAQRRKGDFLGGLWEFPGGKREAGETVEACLRREIAEELGVEVEVGERLAEVRHAYADRRVWIQFFRCRLSRGEPEPLGCEALAWVGPGELGGYEFVPADEGLLTELRLRAGWWRQGSD